MAEKDAQIAGLQEQNKHMHDSVIAANMDSEKTSVAALTNALEDRDRQIDMLKRRLDEAAGDIMVDADLMDEVRQELNRSKLFFNPPQHNWLWRIVIRISLPYSVLYT